MRKIKGIALLLLTFSILFTGCNEAINTPPASQNGTLSVRIVDNSSSRGIEPEGMEVDHYELSARMNVSGGSGPSIGPIAITRDSAATGYTTSVAPGTWTVTVKALNKDGLEIGSGSRSATVVAGATTSVTITVTETVGTGELNINFTDETNSLSNLSATVSKADGTEAGTVILDKNSNVFTGSLSLDFGMYKVVITSGDNELSVDDSVRIYANLTTQYNVSYDGESFVVTTVDEIIRTPEITLTVDATVASNGTLNANISVENLDSYEIEWTLNGKTIKSEYTLDNNVLTYDVSDEGFENNQKIRLSAFVTSGEIIWSESAEVTVTASVTMPDSATITATPESAKYNDQITLSVDGAFEDGTVFSWSVDGKTIDGDTFTATTIGKTVEIAVTASKDGVEKTYTGTIEIAPTATVTVSPAELPLKGILTVTSQLGTPEGATLDLEVNGTELEITDGKVALDGLADGTYTVGWKISYNGDEWTETTENSFKIHESKEDTPAPSTENLADVGGDDKYSFVMDVLNIAEMPQLYETTEGKANLERSYIVKADGSTALASFTSGKYTFWGSGNGNAFDVVVQDNEGNVFTIRFENGKLYLNNVEVVEKSDKPEFRPDDATEISSDTPVFPSWIQGTYVGEINDAFYDEGWAYLTFSDSDFTLLSYKGTERNFTDMYGGTGAQIASQYSNSTDYWECNLEHADYGLTYVIRKTETGISIDYFYNYGYDQQNETILMTAVGDFTKGGNSSFEIPDWAIGTFSGDVNWGTVQTVTATIEENGQIRLDLADGRAYTFDTFYGGMTIMMQVKYNNDTVWDVTFDPLSQGMDYREYTFYSVTKTDSGINVICVADTANGYENNEYITMTRVEEPEPSEAPQVNTSASDFGNTDEERFAFMNTVMSEFPQPGPGALHKEYSGYVTANYTFWGTVTITDTLDAVTIDLVVKENSSDRVFSIYSDTKLDSWTPVSYDFRLCGETVNVEPEVPVDPPEDDIVPDYSELAEPVEPTVTFPADTTEAAEEAEMVALSTVLSDLSSQYPMMAIVLNMDPIENEEIGSYSITMNPTTMETDIEVIEDIATPFGATIHAGSTYHTSNTENSGKIIFTYAGVKYTAEIEYGQTGESMKMIITDSEGMDHSSDQTLKNIATTVFDYVSMQSGMIVYQDEERINPLMNKPLGIEAMGLSAIFVFDHFELDMQSEIIDFKLSASLLNVPFNYYAGEQGPQTKTVSSPGLIYEYTGKTFKLHGPAIIDGVDYYFDCEGLSEGPLTGGVWSNGTWKSF